MKISVIMGLYNSEKTLRESLDSLVRQTFQDFEVIVCDDGSTDSTLTVAESFVPYFKERLIILKNSENKGLAYSLNHCLKAAKGQYVARMDADDIALPHRFEAQNAYLDSHTDIDMVGSDVLLFNQDGVWGRRSYTQTPQKKDFLKTSQFVHPTIIMKKAVLTELKGYTDEKVTRRTEDYDLFMRFYAKGYAAINLAEPLLLYREDHETYKRRAYRYRFDEMRIRYRGFKRMGLLPKGLPYVIRPLIVGLIPKPLLKILKHEDVTPPVGKKSAKV